MEYRYRMSQDELAYTYEHAQARMDAHPEYADKQKLIIQAQSFFKSEKDALQAAIEQRKDNHWGCQIWAMIEKTDGVYRILNHCLEIVGKIQIEISGIEFLVDLLIEQLMYLCV